MSLAAGSVYVHSTVEGDSQQDIKREVSDWPPASVTKDALVSSNQRATAANHIRVLPSLISSFTINVKTYQT